MTIFTNAYTSLIDEGLKFLERQFFMQKSAMNAEFDQNGKTIRPKKE
jgi:hypothetical protein